MRSEQTEPARALGQPQKQRVVIANQPALTGLFPNPFFQNSRETFVRFV
jgi:hypothetical protein